ncbi:protein TsetseEP-like [Sphaeramia orbicularis]|uniref:protein TsetseEP-like n=1 Tax=Sphaeramia orbicularis TaxID=375764 RepID=UPI00117DC331|nr:protein TsetseEP-like [Sphaeramia orbicularis]
MGARFSRRTPANKPESAVTEQTAAEEPVSTQPAEDSEVTQTQEAAAAPQAVEQKPEVVVGEPVTLQACLPAEECTAECKEPEAPAASTPEPEPAAKDTPAQPEPLISLSKPSPPEPVEDPKPVAPAQPEPLISLIESPAPESVEEAKPVVEEVTEAAPETVPEPEPEVEAVTVPDPPSEPEPAPVEASAPEIDLLTQETLPEPELSAAPLIDLGIPEPTPQTIDNPPSPPPSPVPVTADECPEVEEHQESPEVAVISAVVPEEEPSVENPNEATENMEQLVSDVNEESVSGLLKQLDLTGNDLVSDLIDSDVKIPDESSIIDVNTSADMM